VAAVRQRGGLCRALDRMLGRCSGSKSSSFVHVQTTAAFDVESRRVQILGETSTSVFGDICCGVQIFRGKLNGNSSSTYDIFLRLYYEL
jgi:hypothetical protein